MHNDISNKHWNILFALLALALLVACTGAYRAYERVERNKRPNICRRGAWIAVHYGTYRK